MSGRREHLSSVKSPPLIVLKLAMKYHFMGIKDTQKLYGYECITTLGL